MSRNSISLVHPGGTVSQEHLESMCNTALAVQQIVKAEGSARRSSAAKDRFPVYIEPGHVVVQQPDPAQMVKRNRVEVFDWQFDDVFGGPVSVFETAYTTTWHSQFVKVGGWGEAGSKNQRKTDKAWKRQHRIEKRRDRKAAPKVRMTRHDIEQELLHDDVEPWTGDLPVNIHDYRYGMEWWIDEMGYQNDGQGFAWKADENGHYTGTPKVEPLCIEERQEALRRRKADAERMAKHTAKREAREAKAAAKKQADVERMRSYWAGVYQRPEVEQPALRPALREIEEGYFANSRRFILANSRGI